MVFVAFEGPVATIFVDNVVVFIWCSVIVVVESRLVVRGTVLVVV